jgi:hypothetical protein
MIFSISAALDKAEGISPASFTFKDLHPENKDPGGINGSWHWVNSEGRPLWDIAEEFLEKTSGVTADEADSS